MQTGLIQKLSPKLKGAQRRQLRGLAHSLKPIVQVGHELVKVKVVNTFDGAIEDVAIELTNGTQSACVQQIGHILLFYKANPDEPVIELIKCSEKA